MPSAEPKAKLELMTLRSRPELRSRVRHSVSQTTKPPRYTEKTV